MRLTLIDGSRLIVEGAARGGVTAYSGYPITPANRIYSYAVDRISLVLKAPDEITALQWASGLSSTKKLPMTATSRPGFSLMIETLEMAYMMELPILLILVQRLGPSTGSATTGAQGDIGVLRHLISGGYTCPVFCPSDLEDCYNLAAKGARVAVDLRTPVILLTSKEMVQTKRDLSLDQLPEVVEADWSVFQGKEYSPYQTADRNVPPFLPLGNDVHQVRMTGSTHGEAGLLQKNNPEALSNTKRLQDKINQGMEQHVEIEYDRQNQADILILSYGISAPSARKAAEQLRNDEIPVSLLIVKSLLPVPSQLSEMFSSYSQVIVVEENLTGIYRKALWGVQMPSGVYGVNKIGETISPSEIVEKVVKNAV